MKRAERVALRKLEAAEHHLALAYELLHEASAVRPYAAHVGNNVAHINDQVRRERDALLKSEAPK